VFAKNKIKIFTIIFISGILLLGFKASSSKKIIGHWTSEVDLYDMKVNDTLIFTKIKYTDKLYQWAGALAGIELAPDKSFSEFHNVLCSSESSPVRFTDEKWTLHNDLITITGNEREAKWRILNVTNRKMMVVVLKTNSK